MGWGGGWGDLIWRLDWMRSHFQAHLCGCWWGSGSCGVLERGTQFHADCWSEAFLVSLLCKPLRSASHSMADEVWEQARKARERDRGTSVSKCRNSISSFHYILFAWSSSLGAAHAQGLGWHKSMNTRRQALWEPSWKLPITPWSTHAISVSTLGTWRGARWG